MTKQMSKARASSQSKRKSKPNLIVDNTIDAELRQQFFNSASYDGTKLLKNSAQGRLNWLRIFLEDLKEIDPRHATDMEIATTLATLISSGVSQTLIAKELQTSKTTIARWINREVPPRAMTREVIIQRSIKLLEEQIARAAAA